MAHTGREKSNALLAGWLNRNGCVRRPNPARRESEGQRYKKGYEIRLVANSETELETMRQALAQAGFRAGKPYRKRTQHVQPIYGKQAVDRFLRLTGRSKDSTDAGLQQS